MSNTTCTKRCVDCKKTWKGDRTRMQWCDRCGGETVPIPYRRSKRARVSRG